MVPEPQRAEKKVVDIKHFSLQHMLVFFLSIIGGFVLAVLLAGIIPPLDFLFFDYQNATKAFMMSGFGWFFTDYWLFCSQTIIR
jgi:hypothetical protein